MKRKGEKRIERMQGSVERTRGSHSLQKKRARDRENKREPSTTDPVKTVDCVERDLVTSDEAVVVSRNDPQRWEHTSLSSSSSSVPLGWRGVRGGGERGAGRIERAPPDPVLALRHVTHLHSFLAPQLNTLRTSTNEEELSVCRVVEAAGIVSQAAVFADLGRGEGWG